MSIFRKITGALDKNGKLGKSSSCDQVNKVESGPPTKSATKSLEEFILEGRKTGKFLKTNEWQHRKSRLSKSTTEVLHDPPALAYFIQYLEARDAVQLVKFWLDVESFKTSASARISSKFLYERIPPKLEDEPSFIDDDYENLETAESLVPHGDTGSDVSDKKSNDEFQSSIVQSIVQHPDKEISRADLLVKTRTEDAVAIYRRYIAPDAERPVHLPMQFKKDIVEMICAESGQVSADCFSSAQCKVVDILEQEYFPDFLKSEYHAKHLVDVVTGGGVVLSDVLYNDTALSHFMEFMETQSRRSLMEFWLTATNFNQSSSNSSQEDAMILYEKYFSMQASSPLGFDDKVRLHIENNICADGGPNHSCFDMPLEITLQYLDHNYLQRFLISPMFKNYIKELIGTITASPRSLSSVTGGLSAASSSALSRDSDDRSICSSEVSGHSHTVSPLRSHNTLLANADTCSPGGDTEPSPGDNPDLLWRRTPVRNDIGRISSIGRYESTVDHAPDTAREQGTKQTSRISKAVKKLVVNEDHEKLKEEMAWQVAEMFVKEVTCVTMSNNAPGSSDMSKSFSEGYSLVDIGLDLDNLELSSSKYF